MIKHVVIMASAYKLGERIVLHYSDESVLQMDVIKKDYDHIKRVCGYDVPLSTHYIQTDDKSYESISKKDKYFDNTKLIQTADEFAQILKEDRRLDGADVAKYILTQVPCTHLKLQKLVYLCYADYLCEYHRKLFYDKIYAYKYGPVIESVYKMYKVNKKDSSPDNKEKYDEIDRKMPIKSRIVSSKNGMEKLMSINKSLEKYGKYSASELVSITHKEYSPWEKSGSGKEQYKEITDEKILVFHPYEV